jgi:hypothetical protein
VDRLLGDAQGITDLFPRPALLPREGHIGGLYLFSQAMQSTNGAEANCRVRRRDMGSPY